MAARQAYGHPHKRHTEAAETAANDNGEAIMGGWGIAGRLFLAYAVFIVVAAVFVGTAAFVDTRDRGYEATADRMLAVATAIADSPLVVTAAQSPDPTLALQAYTLEVGEHANADFISVLSPSGIRWTHPDAAEIGRTYTGQTAAALAGRPLTEVAAGTVGPSVRAVVPIVDPDGTVVGLVAAGVRSSSLQTALDARLPAMLALTLAMLLVGAIAAGLLGRYLRRSTLGWGPEELAQRYGYADSALNSVREGLVLADRAGRVVYYSDRAARLLGLPSRQGSRGAVLPPTAIDDLSLPPGIASLMQSGRTVHDEVHVTASRELLVSQGPAVPSPGRTRTRATPLGTVTTVVDSAELAARLQRIESRHRSD